MKNYSVLMFDGSTKSIADVERGDILMGPNSKQRIVKNHEICEGEVFEVKPNKGDSFILGDDNYVCLSSRRSAASQRSAAEAGSSNCFLDIHIYDFEKQSEHFKNNHKLYRSPVDFSVISEPTIDPYFMGILLGEGCLRYVPIGITTSENTIIEYSSKLLHGIGADYKIRKRKGSNCSDIFIGAFHKKNNFLRSELRKMQLWEKFGYEKFIPEIYKFGSQNVRLSILAGLIDSDGCLSNGVGVNFDTTSKQLAEDVAFVAGSLGFGCHIGKPRQRNVNWKPCYTLGICGDFSDVPLLVERKIPKPRKSIKNVLRTGFSVHKLKLPAIYYKLEFEEKDQHYLKSDFMIMKGGNQYVL